MSKLRQFFDPFTATLLLVVGMASLFPASGVGAGIFEGLSTGAITLLFFFHGAKLSRQAILAGMGHWRLHSVTLFVTFILFPVLVWCSRSWLTSFLGEELTVGLLFLSALPGTVQSSIAFTSMAGGNVPAAVCNASASNLLGIFVTPVLVGLLLGRSSSLEMISTGDAVLKISFQLLLPFLLAHFSRPLIGAWVDANRSWISIVDRGSVLLIVYTAFSSAVVAGLWTMVPAGSLILLAVVCMALLGVVMWIVIALGRMGRFSRADRIALLFCGSKKSLATGVPMAQILFAGTAAGPVILPIMIFHQIQLMVCAFLAQRFAQAKSV